MYYILHTLRHLTNFIIFERNLEYFKEVQDISYTDRWLSLKCLTLSTLLKEHQSRIRYFTFLL